MTSLDRDRLKDFFAAYFHEDWLVDAAGPDEVISAYLNDGPTRDELLGLSDSILRFADGGLDDARLEQALFAELGCYYQPSIDQVSARAWLEQIATTLLEAANR